MLRNSRGLTLIETLVGMVILVLVSLGAFTFFSNGMGALGKQGNRRAALERARERLDQLMQASFSQVKPADSAVHWLSCAGSPCAWTMSSSKPVETLAVNSLAAQPIETTVQWKDDPAAGTASTQDVLEFTVQVWYHGSTNDNFSRVVLKSLRASSL
jgi:prepilin-type N-terminal cleavage/methylation domain-containing protein